MAGTVQPPPSAGFGILQAFNQSIAQEISLVRRCPTENIRACLVQELGEVFSVRAQPVPLFSSCSPLPLNEVTEITAITRKVHDDHTRGQELWVSAENASGNSRLE